MRATIKQQARQRLKDLNKSTRPHPEERATDLGFTRDRHYDAQVGYSRLAWRASRRMDKVAPISILRDASLRDAPQDEVAVFCGLDSIILHTSARVGPSLLRRVRALRRRAFRPQACPAAGGTGRSLRRGSQDRR